MSNLTAWSAPGVADHEPVAVPRRRWRWFAEFADPSSVLPVLAGVVVTIVGFVLMAIAWADVAALTDVWRQFPYLLSAGLPGLGLVMVGLVLVNVSIRRQDGAARERQLRALTEALQELQRSLEP